MTPIKKRHKFEKNAFYCTIPRICVLTDSFYPIIGGGENLIEQLSRALINRGLDLFVLTQRRLSESPKRETVGNVSVHRIGMSGFNRFGKYVMLPAALFKLLFLKRYYDIIFISGIRTLGVVGVLAAKMLRKKCVLRAASCSEMSGDYALKPPHLLRFRLMNKFIKFILLCRNRIYRTADGFISISNAIREEYEICSVNHERVVSIFNGVDLEKFCPINPEKKPALRRRLHIPDKKIVIYTGKLNQGKGLQMLLRAWRRVLQNCSIADLHLMLVGSGVNQYLSCEAELRDYVDKNRLKDFVTFTGNVRNVQEYLQASDFFTLPSESEAMPNALIEAMATGLPVIVTAAGGIKDIVETGQNGIMIEINDEDALVESILTLTHEPDKAKRLGKAGLKTVIKRFSLEMAVDHYEAFFKKILNNGQF